MCARFLPAYRVKENDGLPLRELEGHPTIPPALRDLLAVLFADSP